MDTAKIFKNGSSQAVRLPQKYRFDQDDVYIKKIDNIVMLIPKDKVWEIFRNSFDKFSDDIHFERVNDLPQERDFTK